MTPLMNAPVAPSFISQFRHMSATDEAGNGEFPDAEKAQSP